MAHCKTLYRSESVCFMQKFKMVYFMRYHNIEESQILGEWNIQTNLQEPERVNSSCDHTYCLCIGKN